MDWNTWYYDRPYVILVKAVLTSIAIYYSTILEVPVEVLLKIDSIRRAFLWVASEKVFGGKCKVNWEGVGKPKLYGGLGILNLPKFASTLRLRWLWQKWSNEPKPWLNLGGPCNHHDHELFVTTTIVTIGNREKASFWNSSWLEGRRPKDIATLSSSISQIKGKLRCKEIWLENIWSLK